MLLDEHLSPGIAAGLQRIEPGIEVYAISQWKHGRFLGRADQELLAEAAHGLTFVTYDCRSIPDLLRFWGEQGRSHSGVIFVDDKSIAPGDIGGLVRALGKLFSDLRHLDWENREMFLPRYP
ncbi:MAG TPA: hypothetical protein VHU89_14790 [Acidobacteriaceae bacterium]|nr:hypothetical protein [Acidobacteriaceae bacterium]